jgi:hypothetical protein
MAPRSPTKVAATDAPGALILHIGGRERAALAKEARELRAVIVDGISHAEASAREGESADGSKLEDRYAELFELAYVLNQLEYRGSSNAAIEVVGPTDLLVELTRGAAIGTGERLADALAHHRDSPSSARELLVLADAAKATIETLVECQRLAAVWQR